MQVMSLKCIVCYRSPQNSTPVPVYWSEQAWWSHLHQVSNPRPRLRCWETAKTHGSAILWSSASDESCEGAITACLREKRLTGCAYITRLHDEVSIAFDITEVGFLCKSFFCGLWTTTSASIINPEINHEGLNTWGEFTKKNE